MHIKETLQLLCGMIMPAYLDRFLVELAEALLHTFLRANLVMGGLLAFAAGTAVERLFSKGAEAVFGVAGLDRKCLVAAIVVHAILNYAGYRSLSRARARTPERAQACGFLASLASLSGEGEAGPLLPAPVAATVRKNQGPPHSIA